MPGATIRERLAGLVRLETIDRRGAHRDEDGDWVKYDYAIYACERCDRYFFYGSGEVLEPTGPTWESLKEVTEQEAIRRVADNDVS
ncbi:MAG: hypothetical protein ACYS22_01175 [Planctomycetota bacterium]